MLVRLHKMWATALALFLVISLAPGSCSIESHFSQPQTSQIASAHKEHQADAQDQKQRADEAIAHYTLGLMIFTGVLAAATIGLGIVTAGLYGAGVHQLNIARDEFLSTHRPKIIVHSAELKRLRDPNKSAESKLDRLGVTGLYYNMGRGVAYNVEVRAEIVVSKEIPNANVQRNLVNKFESVESGAKIQIDIESDRRIEGLRDFTGLEFAWFVGTLVYHGHKRRRETGFCFVFDTKNMRWNSAESREHEYAY